MFDNNEGNIRVEWLITHNKNMIPLIKICLDKEACDTCIKIGKPNLPKRQIFIRTQLTDTRIPNIDQYNANTSPTTT